MAQKLVIGLLVLTLVGAGAVGLYDAARQPVEETLAAADGGTIETQDVSGAALVVPGTDETAPAAIAADPLAAVAAQGGPGSAGQGAGDGTGPIAADTQQQSSLDNVGDAWTAEGTIVALDDMGMTLALADGSTVYVELGQPDFWQTQGVTLVLSDAVTVDGFYNGDRSSGQVHARIVTVNATGAQITVRNETGQPLWSGGTSGGNANAGGAGSAGNTGDVQVAAEDWITLQGVIMTLETNGVTMLAEDGSVLTLELGQASFWQGQGVTLAVGDEIEVLGFWQGNMFQAGELRKLATGERIMLRDPNGRPLWGGPGRNGNGNTSGNTSGAGTGNGGTANGAGAGAGNAGAGNGGGNGNANAGGNGGNANATGDGTGNAAANATNGNAAGGSAGAGNATGGRQYRGGRTE